MHAALLYRTLTSSEIREVKAKAPGVIYHSPMIAPPLDFDGSIQSFELHPDEKKRLAEEMFAHVLAFGDIIINSKPVSQWLAFGRSSDWFYHRFRIYFELRSLSYVVEEIRLLSARHPEVVVYHDNNLLAHFQGLPANAKLRMNGSASLKPRVRGVARYAISFAYRAIEGFFQLRRSRTRRHIILYRPIQEHALLSLDGETIVRDSFLLGYMLSEAPDEFLLIGEFNAPSAARPFKLRRRQFGRRPKGRCYLNGEHLLFRALLNPSVAKERKQIVRGIHEALNVIGDHIDDPYHKLIVRRLKSLDGARKYNILRKLAIQRFFRKRHVLTATGTDENNSFTRAQLDAFKELGVRTIGIQHGIVGHLHPAYNFTKTDMRMMPIPDTTICWGEEWKRLLVEEGNYPEDSLIVCGQQRTDLIPVLKHQRKSEVISGLSDQRPLLVFASQPQPDPLLRERAAHDVFEAAKLFPQLQVVLKLHPREEDTFDYYKRIAHEAGVLDPVIVLDIDLYRLISVCDMLVTCFSTVGSEAIYFSKPLIVLDHLKQDLLGYVKHGVAFQASDAEELAKCIHRILINERVDPDNVERYISKFAYRIDGRARFRYLETILGRNFLTQDSNGVPTEIVQSYPSPEGATRL